MATAIQRQGYYENGKCYINDTTSIPNSRTRITVIFHDIGEVRQKKLVAIKGILADALNAESELSDADWNEMAFLRSQTNVGLTRGVEV